MFIVNRWLGSLVLLLGMLLNAVYNSLEYVEMWWIKYRDQYKWFIQKGAFHQKQCKPWGSCPVTTHVKNLILTSRVWLFLCKVFHYALIESLEGTSETSVRGHWHFVLILLSLIPQEKRFLPCATVHPPKNKATATKHDEVTLCRKRWCLRG